MITIYFDIQKAAHAEMRFNTLYSAKSLYSTKASCGAIAPGGVKTPKGVTTPYGVEAPDNVKISMMQKHLCKIPMGDAKYIGYLFDVLGCIHAEYIPYSTRSPDGAKALYIVKTPRSAIAPTGARALYSATTYNYIKMKKRNVCNESTCVHCIVNVVGSLHQLSLMNMYVNILDLNQNAPFDVKAVLKNKKRILRRK